MIRTARLALPLLIALAPGAALAGEDTAKIGDVEITGISARPAPVAGGATAVHMILHNTGEADTALVSAESPAARIAQIHDMSMDGGVMRMGRIDSVPIPAGGTAELAAGGRHIMLIGLEHALLAGDSVMLRLCFRPGECGDVEADILPYGSDSPEDASRRLTAPGRDDEIILLPQPGTAP
jgi:copper(I)-binding protein